MSNSLLIRTLAVLSLLTLSVASSQAKSVPYATVDPYTLHMYHFDSAQTVTNNGNTTVTDLVSPGISLAVQNTAKLIPSYSEEFGNALCTSSTTVYSRATAGLVTPSSFWNLTTTTMMVNNTLTTVATGACTYEAIIMVGRNPATTFASGIGSQDQIISMENSTSTGRPMQFRIQWKNTAATPITTPELDLVGAEAGGTVGAALPLSGQHAVATGKWYHVMATYNGRENTPGNVHLYWTALDSDAKTPNELTPVITGTGYTPMLTTDLRNTAKTYFMVGGQGRSANCPGFVGYIDEVRISKIVRSSTDTLVPIEMSRFSVE